MAVFLLTRCFVLFPVFMNTLVASTLDSTITKRHQLFTTLVGVVAFRHKAYLEEQATAIEACYTLELHNGEAHIEMEQWVPLTLGYELYHCFAKSFE
ncbi:hypothetical protein [Hymenobacter volaticus]|uniref:Secreted protein n=1 Tax=Hymenobacter volaticus TaxID=2932254 RepID=A0ABY4GFK6_9BACT|nr:hypothetical protein [Hymenobacter volaticus]UOQ69720.1 hypothetical protein MUN86_29865 [Hymenobacter volaticus]